MGFEQSAISNVAKVSYQSGLIKRQFVSAGDGIHEMAKAKAKKFEMGGRKAHFALRLGLPASAGNVGESGTYIGRSGTETVTTMKYQKYELAMRFYHGIIQTSKVARELSDGPGNDAKFMLNAWAEEMMGIVETMGEQQALLFFTGKEGTLFQCTATSMSNITGNEYTVYINNAPSDSKFLTDARLAGLNWPVDIVDTTAGPPYTLAESNATGYITDYGVDSSGNHFVNILFKDTLSTIPSAMSTDYAIRWQRRQSQDNWAAYEVYGLPDMIATSTFPSDTNLETTLNPATSGNGQWKSIVKTASNQSIKDIDDFYYDMYMWGGVKPDQLSNYACITTRGVVNKLLQEKHDQVDYMQTSSNDMRKSGYTMLVNGKKFMEHRLCQRGHIWVFPYDVMGYHEHGGKGPFFTPQGRGTRRGAEVFSISDSSTPTDYMNLQHICTRTIIQRNRTGVLKSME